MKDFISCPNVKICHFEDQEIDFLGLMPKSAAEAVDGARVRSECLPGYFSATYLGLKAFVLLGNPKRFWTPTYKYSIESICILLESWESFCF